MSQPEVRLAVSGDVHGHVVIGDHNLVVSEGGSVLALLQSGERPVPSRRDHVELLSRRIPPPQGRDAELERLKQYVADSSTVQVYGPPGIGKTTLLRQAAHRLAERGTELAFLPAAGRTAGDLAQDVFEACAVTGKTGIGLTAKLVIGGGVAAYAKGGWQASLAGPAATAAQQYNTLTITHGTDRVTIPNVGTFAWSG